MIISHKYKFIFIKTAKTAGSSIEFYLSNICGDKDIVTPIKPAVSGHYSRNNRGLFNPLPEILNSQYKVQNTIRDLVGLRKFWNHIPASVVRARIDHKIWKNYYKFCVERNPWDKTLSHYNMLKYRENGSLSLEEYLQKQNFCYNFQRYTDSNLNIIVDKVLLFENLNTELSKVFKELNIPFTGKLDIKLKSEYKKKSEKISLTTDQKNVLAEAFKVELQLHGY